MKNRTDHFHKTHTAVNACANVRSKTKKEKYLPPKMIIIFFILIIHTNFAQQTIYSVRIRNFEEEQNHHLFSLSCLRIIVLLVVVVVISIMVFCFIRLRIFFCLALYFFEGYFITSTLYVKGVYVYGECIKHKKKKNKRTHSQIHKN